MTAFFVSCLWEKTEYISGDEADSKRWTIRVILGTPKVIWAIVLSIYVEVLLKFSYSRISLSRIFQLHFPQLSHYHYHHPSRIIINVMHYTTFLYAATALYATSVSSYCFRTGANWGDHGVAKAQLAEACKEFKGNYNANQPWRVCRDSPTEDKSFVFQVQNAVNHGRFYPQDKCEEHIGREIDHCGHGGEENIQGWVIR